MDKKLFNELLMKRIIVIEGDIDEEIANLVVAQFLFLYEDSKDKDIFLIINSLGGSITAGMAIYDLMKYLKCDINTICLNISCAMATILLSSGTKGKRYCMKNSIINPNMGLACSPKGIEQILGEESKRVISMKEQIISIMSQNTGVEMEKMRLLCEMTNMLNSELAQKCGLIDTILEINVQENDKSRIDDFEIDQNSFEREYYKNILADLKNAGVLK